MRWHAPNVEPELDESNSHCIIKLKNSNEYKFVKWNLSVRHFYDDKDTHYSMGEVEKWCYVEEDDCTIDEMFALNAIYDAVKHVQSLYDILLTDGICCGEEYRNLVGLNELQIIKEKLTKRIIYLDDLIEV